MTEETNIGFYGLWYCSFPIDLINHDHVMILKHKEGRYLENFEEILQLKSENSFIDIFFYFGQQM